MQLRSGHGQSDNSTRLHPSINIAPPRAVLFSCRVLQPGGSFLLVTLGDPTRRLPLLLDPRLQWKVSLLLLPKISAACQAYVDGK